MSSPGLDDLITRSRQALPSKICWRTVLTGLADEYMTEIDKLSYPGEIVGTAVTRILEELGVEDLNEDKVRRHLRGGCRCQKPLRSRSS
jgi:hypothetical protein